MIWVWVIIGFVALQRLAELPHAERNTRALMAKGAVESSRCEPIGRKDSRLIEVCPRWPLATRPPAAAVWRRRMYSRRAKSTASV